MTVTPPDKIKPWWRFRVTVEPVMLVASYLTQVSSSPLTDLVMSQSCELFSQDPANCTNDEATIEDIHRLSSSFSMWRMIIDTLPGCIMSLFVGPWSSTNGRKPILIIALVGVALYHASLCFLSTVPHLHPYVLLVSGLPLFFTGGTILLYLNVFSYIIDITNEDNRVLRVALVTNSLSAGVLLAQLAAPPLERMGYTWLFGTNFATAAICALYVIFILPESINVIEENKKTLFTVDHLKESFKTMFKKRPNHSRGILISLVLTSACLMLIWTGEPDIMYLSTIKKFHWNIDDYTTYTAVHSVLLTVGTFSGVFIGLKLLKLTERTFGVSVLIFYTGGSLWLTWSKTPQEFYVAANIRIFVVCVNPVVRSLMSKAVPPEDVSTVIGFHSSAEAFMPQIAAVIYAKFYNLVVGFDSFAVYYLSTLLCLLSTISFTMNVILYHLGKRKDSGSPKEITKPKKDDKLASITADKDLESNT